MQKAMTIEIWVDETLEDAKECVDDVYFQATCHEYIYDGSVKIKVVDTNKTIMK